MGTLCIARIHNMATVCVTYVTYSRIRMGTMEVTVESWETDKKLLSGTWWM